MVKGCFVLRFPVFSLLLILLRWPAKPLVLSFRGAVSQSTIRPTVFDLQPNSLDRQRSFSLRARRANLGALALHGLHPLVSWQWMAYRH